MSVDRIVSCDEPRCGEHVRTAARAPFGFLTLTGAGPTKHFCSIDCLFKWAGTQEPDKLDVTEESTDA